MTDKKAIFIRHNFRGHRSINEYLWKNNLIAIHYDNVDAVNPDQYEKQNAKNAIKRLVNYCENGVIVAATYRDYQPDKIKIGEIEKGSKIEYLNSKDVIQSGDYIYKTVEIKNPQEISYNKYPLLAAIQPQQATITGWPSAEKYLNVIVKNEEMIWDVNFLPPSQLEVICYEYLKMLNLIQVLLLPIGRSLMDIDIFGFDGSGNKVFAQVTNSQNNKDIEKKIEKLNNYQGQSIKLIFFGPEKCKNEFIGIEYISIESVFKKLISNENSIQYKMISEMFKVP